MTSDVNHNNAFLDKLFGYDCNKSFGNMSKNSFEKQYNHNEAKSKRIFNRDAQNVVPVPKPVTENSKNIPNLKNFMHNRHLEKNFALNPSMGINPSENLLRPENKEFRDLYLKRYKFLM
ncbi:hypothetical protein MHBO_001345 [Bonamia ostreae]|uniref:Uncharacterized protein n=1 Tax=Bonamia ostreae TaxID=126728 RepID=A0ABV2AIP0_9EUKA